MGYNVAIDGPAGAGKSTIAKLVAKQKGFIYVDTGAMYRAIGLYMLKNNIDVKDQAAVEEAVKLVQVSLSYEDGAQQVILNGENVSTLIRTQEVSSAASVTSAYPAVRAALLNLQLDMAKNNDVVMDGRDIGTAILPDADLKIFLTASSEVRATRRMKEYEEKGESCDFETLKKEIEERDHQDMTRAISPLVQAEDALLLDSSDMTIDEVVSKIISLVRN